MPHVHIDAACGNQYSVARPSRGWRSRRKFCASAGTLLLALLPAAAQGPVPPSVKIDLEQAIQLALAHNHNLKAARSTIDQSRAQEITASLRPNPVFTYDDLFVPLSPSQFTAANLNQITEFDVGASYTWERGHKRQARLRAARDQTAVTVSTVKDEERTLTFNVAQQFINALLAKSTLELAQADLASFQQTVDISAARLKAGDISEADYLKIKLQLLQFQNDVASAQLSRLQTLATLRQQLGYESVPPNYDVAGELVYTPLKLNREDLLSMALGLRPDLVAAKQGVTAAESQYLLAKANAKRDVTTTLDYTHVSAINSASFIFNMELPIFDRNQGEIARTHYAITQSQENRAAAEEAVRTDVINAYEAWRTADEVVRLYQSGYLKNAEDSRDISAYAYKRGAASLLDYLDAERSYRAIQLAYRQSLATYMLAIEQLREAVGTRNLP
jgi:cobalt-zinc-cadmium efflux system outer membrane protein